MTEPIVLPPKPVPLDGESAAAFDARMLNWWRECDILLRTDCQARKAAWMASIEPNLGPTLVRIADAWDAFDVRLGELVGALNSQPEAPGGFSAEFTLQLLRLVLDKPEAPASGG